MGLKDRTSRWSVFKSTVSKHLLLVIVFPLLLFTIQWLSPRAHPLFSYAGVVLFEIMPSSKVFCLHQRHVGLCPTTMRKIKRRRHGWILITTLSIVCMIWMKLLRSCTKALYSRPSLLTYSASFSSCRKWIRYWIQMVLTGMGFTCPIWRTIEPFCLNSLSLCMLNICT